MNNMIEGPVPFSVDTGNGIVPHRRESDQDPDWRNPDELLRAYKDRKISRAVFLAVIHSLPKNISDHENPVKVFEELEKAGASSDTIAEIMGFFGSESIVIGGDEEHMGNNISLHFHKDEEDEEIDLERIGILMKRLENKKGRKLKSIDKTNIHKDDAVILRFSKKKREGEEVVTVSFEIALLVEYVFSSTMACLAQMDNPEPQGSAFLINANIRLPVWSEGERQMENLMEKIGQHLDKEKRDMLSERYLREIILIPSHGAGVMALWKSIREGVGNILGK